MNPTHAGEPRFTNDVDVVVFLRFEDIRRLIEVFPAPSFYLPPEEIIAAEIARAHKGQFNVIHVDTGFKADIYTTGRDDFNAWSFRHARRLDFMGEPSRWHHLSASSSASWNTSVKVARRNTCATSGRF